VIGAASSLMVRVAVPVIKLLKVVRDIILKDYEWGAVFLLVLRRYEGWGGWRITLIIVTIT
jgi:hypothetical protein